MSKKQKRDQVDSTHFFCIRLKDENKHKTLIQGFSSKRNPGLANYLKTKAWLEDTTNYRAFYLVRDGEKIVMYFSLQCGLLFKSKKKQLSGILHKDNCGVTEYYVDDDKVNVTKVIPAVELAHFCVNDSYKKRKDTWIIKKGLDEYSVGAYIFYEYIAPKIISLADAVGLQYVYLFCADDGTEKLLEYYLDVLRFNVMEGMACVQSEYDSSLDCLTIKISQLESDLGRFSDMDRLSQVLEYMENHNTISIHQAKSMFGIKDASYLFERIVANGMGVADSTSQEGALLRIKSASRFLYKQ